MYVPYPSGNSFRIRSFYYIVTIKEMVISRVAFRNTKYYNIVDWICEAYKDSFGDINWAVPRRINYFLGVPVKKFVQCMWTLHLLWFHSKLHFNCKIKCTTKTAKCIILFSVSIHNDNCDSQLHLTVWLRNHYVLCF